MWWCFTFLFIPLFQAKVPKSSTKPSTGDVESLVRKEVVPLDIGADVSKANSNSGERDFPKPAEDNLNKEILSLRQDVIHLTTKRDAGLATDDQLKDLQTKRKILKDKQNSLKILQNNRERQRRKRENDKKVLQDNPELAQMLKKRNKTGRPNIVEDQPDLLKAIVDIATHGAAADDRRRSETLRSIKTLDELTTELKSQAYVVILIFIHAFVCSY